MTIWYSKLLIEEFAKILGSQAQAEKIPIVTDSYETVFDVFIPYLSRPDLHVQFDEIVEFCMANGIPCQRR